MASHIFSGLLLVFFTSPLLSQNIEVSEKKRSSIFNPTAKDKMREMETDRPDVTESAYTVDAGHFQYETDAFKTSITKSAGIKTIQNIYNQGNFKIGITNETDLQVIVQCYVTSKVEDPMGNQLYKQSGFGDISLRVKRNLWGNDEGKTALSIMPYITFPTSSNNTSIEGGVIFPFAVEMQNGWGFGSQVQIDIIKNEENRKYHPAFLNSFVINKVITSKTGVFTESFYFYDLDKKKLDFFIDGGLAFSITENIKLDAGTNIGITKGSDKVYFAGFSFRY
jgi:hypothetical protein